MDNEFEDQNRWHEVTPDLRRRVLRVLARDLCILVIVAGVGEIGVRWFLPHYSRFIYTPSITGGHPKTKNSFGLRGGEFSRERPEHETRILCLGNSTTFGSGVAHEDAFPKQLESILNQDQPGGNYFVINGGGEGGTPSQALEFLKRDGFSFDPQIVVLGFSPSMLGIVMRDEADAISDELSRGSRRTPSLLIRASRTLRQAALRVHHWLRSTYLYSFCDANMRRTLYGLDILRGSITQTSGAVFSYAFDVPGIFIDEVEVSYTHLSTALGDLQALLDKRQIPFIVVGLPSRFVLSHQPADNLRRIPIDKIRIKPIDRIAGYCAELGIVFVDMKQRLQAERRAMLDGTKPWEELYNPLDYTHLNPLGLGMVAEALHETMEAQGWLGAGG